MIEAKKEQYNIKIRKAQMGKKKEVDYIKEKFDG